MICGFPILGITRSTHVCIWFNVFFVVFKMHNAFRTLQVRITIFSVRAPCTRASAVMRHMNGLFRTCTIQENKQAW